MRLLQSDDDGNLSLTEFSEHEIAAYAILSHTWGPDEEEVTFDDIMHGSGKDKAGYEKIRFCREQARRDGLQYFWIDTCCIDKSNNAELSRSLNSMFRWYRNAAQCYIYLTDVTDLDIDDGCAYKQPWESQFQHRNLDTSRHSGSRDLAPPLLRLAQARLNLGLCLLRLAQACSGMLTHPVRYRQLLTRNQKRSPSSERSRAVPTLHSPQL